MVDLPKVPRRFVTSEAPNSSLTRADIASPYTSLARAMGEIGEGLSAIGEAGAEEAAARAVVTNPDGSVTVERPVIPFVGRAGEKFERYVKVGAVAAADTQADRALIDLRAANPDDPDGFMKAAAAFRDKHVGNLAPHIGEAGAAALRRQIDSRITQTYGGLKNEHERRALVRADHSLVARITSMDNEMVTLARKGGIGEDYQERLGNVRTLLQERVNAPNSTFTQEQADLYLDDLNTRAQGAAIHEQMERVYRERGFEAAREYLRGSVQGLDGKIKQLDKIERDGLKWLRSEEVGYRAERFEVSREWQATRPQAATMPRDRLIELRDQAAAVGNHRVASDIDAHMSALDHLSTIRSLPASQRAFVAVTGVLPQNVTPAQREVQASIENEARRQGVDPKIAVAVGWRESALGAKTVAATSSARGVFQLIEANRQRFGLSPDAPVQEQVRAGVTMLKETTDHLRTTLGREPTAAEVYMGHFQGAGAAAAIIRAAPDADLKTVLDGTRPNYRGPNGETWGDTVIKANPFLKQLGTAGGFRDWANRAMGVEGRVDLTQTRGGLLALGMVKKEMAGEITRDITNLRQTIAKEEFPPVEEVIALGEKVHAIGTPEQQREVNELVAIAKVGQQFATLSAPQRAQLIAEADADLKNGAARFDSRLRATLRKTDQDITNAYKTDPYGAFARFSRTEAAQATPAVDFADPGTAAAILGLRVKQQAIIREEQGIGPFSALRPAEVEAVRGVLASGDAKATAGVFAVLGQLPDEVLAATLRDDKIKAGIVGAVHTTDPAKFNAVMSALDTWHARDPIEFPKRFGEETWNQLKNWQTNLRYMTPEQLSEERRKALDPGQAERRKVNMQEGQSIARKVKPEDIVAGIGTAWSLTPGFIATNVTGSQALPPVEGATRDALMGDYETVFKRRYADTLDKDVAHQQTVEALRTKWTRSEANGGRLMLRAPEIVYPAIDNSHAWMKPQIESAIAAQLGVGRNTVGTNALGGKVALGPGLLPIPLPVGKTNWDYTLVTDRDTETEALRYDRNLPVGDGNRAPSYQIVVRDNRETNPKWKPLVDASGKEFRFSFDPNQDQVRAAEAFEAERARRAEPPQDVGTMHGFGPVEGGGEAAPGEKQPSTMDKITGFLGMFNPIGSAQAHEQDQYGQAKDWPLFKGAFETSEQRKERIRPFSEGIMPLVEAHEKKIGKPQYEWTAREFTRFQETKEFKALLKKVPPYPKPPRF